MKTRTLKPQTQELNKILSITGGTLIIVVGFAAIFRLGKIMIVDCKEMGL